jgi:hypothetical protein
MRKTKPTTRRLWYPSLRAQFDLTGKSVGRMTAPDAWGTGITPASEIWRNSWVHGCNLLAPQFSMRFQTS